MSDTPDQQNSNDEIPPAPDSGLTRPPTSKPKLKLTKKASGKTGSKGPIKLGKKSDTPVTLPPFQSKSPSETPSDSQEGSAPLPPPPPSTDSGEDAPSDLPPPPAFGGTEDAVPGLPPVPPAPPSFEEPGDADADTGLPPPPPVAESGEEAEPELPSPSPFSEGESENVEELEASLPSPPAFGGTGDSVPGLPPVPPAPPNFEEPGDAGADAGLPPPPPEINSGEESTAEVPPPAPFSEGESENLEEPEAILPPPPAFGDSGDADLAPDLPPPPVLGESTEVPTEGDFEETGSDEFEDSEEESAESEKTEEETAEAESESPELVDGEQEEDSNKEETVEEFTEAESESLEHSDGMGTEVPKDEEQDSSEMTPFEISENFRNLKINIMMVKGSFKELRSELDEIRGGSAGQSGDSESANENEAKFSELTDQFSSAESVLSENSAELQNLTEQFQVLKSSFAEVEDIVRGTNTEDDGDGAANLKALESSLESLKHELAESESKREENKKVMLSLLDQFNQLQESQTGPQATEQSVVAGGNDMQASDGRLSELTEKLDGFSQRIEQLENQEQPPPPPPPLATNDSAENSEIVDRLTVLSEKLEDISDKVIELENAEEPPPPPAISKGSTEGSADLEEIKSSIQSIAVRLDSIEAGNSDSVDDSSSIEAYTTEEKLDSQSQPVAESPSLTIVSSDPLNPVVKIGIHEKTYKDWLVIWLLTYPETQLENELVFTVRNCNEFAELHRRLRC